jgi:hypothetical protein
MVACLIFALVGPLTAYAQPLTRAPSETLNLRVPGTTVRFDLAKVEAGTVKGGEGDEAPSTDIGSMLVLTTELTWDLYDIFVYQLDEPDGTSPADAVSRPSKPYVPPDRGFGHDGYPAIGMTRFAAEAFCTWMSHKLGVTVRLPTQPEWIYLARGGSDAPYCCDADAESIMSYAWLDANSEHSTHPVGEKLPNAFGLYDIHGNAAEWVMTDTRRPFAMGGGYRNSAADATATSAQKQVSAWNQSDPQIPKSQWWLADCSWVGFRFVIDATEDHVKILEELSNE